MVHPHPSLRDTFPCLGEGIRKAEAIQNLQTGNYFHGYKYTIAAVKPKPSPRQGKGDRVQRWMRMHG